MNAEPEMFMTKDEILECIPSIKCVLSNAHLRKGWAYSYVTDVGGGRVWEGDVLCDKTFPRVHSTH